MSLKSKNIPIKSEGVQLYNYVSDSGDVSSSRFNSMEGGAFSPTPPANNDDSVNLDALPVKHSLFYDDMRTGLNTRDKWWVSSITNTTGSPTYSLLPYSINRTVPTGRGWSTEWNRDTETLNVDTTEQIVEKLVVKTSYVTTFRDRIKVKAAISPVKIQTITQTNGSETE